MTKPLLCPQCGSKTGNLAIMHPIYGPTRCQQEVDADNISYTEEAVAIGMGKKEKRMAHWDEIRSRVTTHEGEFLSGKAGREYQKKWSKQMLGTDLSRPANYSHPSYQKELNK